MGTHALRKRANWQDQGGKKAGIAESNFYKIFDKEFAGTDFQIRSHPPEFKNIYSKIVLTSEVLASIYTPKGETWKHGIIPDYAIDNLKTKKTLYVEVKRQDGWVEGKQRKAGRGNVHERSCKFFTPGLLKILREQGKIGNDILPFWVVFQGDIARDPKRVREITCWYAEQSDHFFMWGDSSDKQPLLNHFNKKLRHLLT
jgi:hypothetical protein